MPRRLIVQVSETTVGVSTGSAGNGVVVTDTVGFASASASCFGGLDGFALGLTVGFGVRLGLGSSDAVGTLTGMLFLAGVRGGEVRGGRGVTTGLAGGFTDGLTDAGGLNASGGSDPGEPGSSAMITPPAASPLNMSVAAVRR